MSNKILQKECWKRQNRNKNQFDFKIIKFLNRSLHIGSSVWQEELHEKFEAKERKIYPQKKCVTHCLQGRREQ